MSRESVILRAPYQCQTPFANKGRCFGRILFLQQTIQQGVWRFRSILLKIQFDIDNKTEAQIKPWDSGHERIFWAFDFHISVYNQLTRMGSLKIAYRDKST